MNLLLPEDVGPGVLPECSAGLGRRSQAEVMSDDASLNRPGLGVADWVKTAFGKFYDFEIF